MSSSIVEVLRSLDAAMSSLGLRWYLFGAQAAILHGAARATADADVTVELGGVTPKALVAALETAGFAARVDADDDEFIERSRVLPVVHVESSLPVDVVLAGPGLEDLFFERLTRVEVEGLSIPVASAEDMVVMKLLAGRPLDLEDARAILEAKGPALDIGHVETLLTTLEKALDQHGLVATLDDLRRRAKKRRRTLE